VVGDVFGLWMTRDVEVSTSWFHQQVKNQQMKVDFVLNEVSFDQKESSGPAEDVQMSVSRMRNNKKQNRKHHTRRRVIYPLLYARKITRCHEITTTPLVLKET
jgi:hypothetical protein